MKLKGALLSYLIGICASVGGDVFSAVCIVITVRREWDCIGYDLFMIVYSNSADYAVLLWRRTSKMESARFA